MLYALRTKILYDPKLLVIAPEPLDIVVVVIRCIHGCLPIQFPAVSSVGSTTSLPDVTPMPPVTTPGPITYSTMRELNVFVVNDIELPDLLDHLSVWHQAHDHYSPLSRSVKLYDPSTAYGTTFS